MFRRSALSLPLAAAFVVAAFAVVDVEVRNGDKVSGTLAPASATETIRFRVPKGALITVKAAAAKKPLQLRVLLKDPNGVAVGAPAEGRSATLAKRPAGVSGLYSVEVTSKDGVAVGDYTFAATWKSQTSFGGKRTLAAATPLDVEFAADAGATATFTVKKAKKSAATPVLESWSDGVTPSLGLVGTTQKRTAPATADCKLTVTSSTAGDVTATVKVKPPAASRRKYALTTKAIGLGDSAFSQIVGPAGGMVVFPPAGAAQLDGTSVQFPAGALPVSTSIVIATAPDILQDPTTEIGAGATVAFGPDGIAFGTKSDPKTATVTIPFDTAYAAQKDDVVIYTRDARGVVKAVPKPYAFDLVAKTVSFSTSHFSSFRAVAPFAGGGGNFTTLAPVDDPRDVCSALDLTGSEALLVFIAEAGPNIVGTVKVGPGGLVHATWVGGGGQTTLPAPRLQFQFPGPVVSVYQNLVGVLFAATSRQVFSVDPTTGTVTLVAGTGAVGDSGDGGQAVQATFTDIRRILADQNGLLWIADLGAHRIRLVGATGTITAYAGAGATGVTPDGGAISTTAFVGPTGMSFAPNGEGLYVADGARIRWISPASTPSPINQTIAGSAAGLTGAGGDDGPPLAATFQSISSISAYFDPSNPTDDVAMVADAGDHVVRAVNFTKNKVTLIAGAHGTSGFDGDVGSTPGHLNAPNGIYAAGGLVFVSDKGNQRVRSIVVTQ